MGRAILPQMAFSRLWRTGKVDIASDRLESPAGPNHVRGLAMSRDARRFQRAGDRPIEGRLTRLQLTGSDWISKAGSTSSRFRESARTRNCRPSTPEKSRRVEGSASHDVPRSKVSWAAS